MFKHFLVGLTIIGLLSACQSNDSAADSHLDPAIENSIDSLLRLMTLEEKLGQMTQYRGSRDFASPSPGRETQSILEQIKQGKVGALLNVSGSIASRKVQEMAVNQSRLGIPILFGYEAVHGFMTMFPLPLAEAASWDIEAIERSARITAIEATSAGVHWTSAPTANVLRDARWGHMVKGTGEDPYLASLIAAAKVKGLQGDDLKAKNTIASSAELLLPPNATDIRRDLTVEGIDEHTWDNIILPPLQAAVGAGTVSMQASLLGGDLTVQELRDRLGFNGYLLSTEEMMKEWVEAGTANDLGEAIELGANAGYDMNLGSTFPSDLLTLVEEGKVSKKKIDQAVRRVLRVKFELGLFADPYRYCNPAAEKQDLMHRNHVEAARDIARKSIVLLKNEKDLLPISADARTIAVIGPMANDRDSPLGSWRARARTNSAVSLVEGLRESLNSNTRLLYARGARLTVGKRGPNNPLSFNESDRSGFPEAIAMAKQADVVIVALGEDCWQTGSAVQQEDIRLPGLQEELLKEIYKVNKNLVLVLMNGRPLTFNWAADNVPAIVEAWHLGHMSGMAISEVLLGRYNPSGKLPVSFPNDVSQCPIYYNHQKQEGGNGAARFPFGFGLSYTKFNYDSPSLSSTQMQMRDTLQLSVVLTNSGDLEGEEVVQLYLQDVSSSVPRPVKELKGFRKIKLAPGAKETVAFKIVRDDLAFYGANRVWTVEPGLFKVFVGTNSRDVQEVQFELITE